MKLQRNFNEFISAFFRIMKLPKYNFILIREGVYLKKGRGVFIWNEYNVKSKWKPRTITKPNLVKGRNYVKS